jgi:hypothetical protein
VSGWAASLFSYQCPESNSSILSSVCASLPKAGAQFRNAARGDLCGGRWVTGVPTAMWLIWHEIANMNAIISEIDHFPALLCQSKISSASQAYDCIINFAIFCIA